MRLGFVSGLFVASAALAAPPTMLLGHTNAVDAFAFSADSKQVATGSFDKTARVWDPSSGMPHQTFTGHQLGVTGVAFSPDGALLATSSIDTHVRVFDVASGKLLADWASPADLTSVVWVEGGKAVLISDVNGDATLVAFDGKSLTPVPGKKLLGHNLTLSPDRKWVVAGTSDGTLQLYDAATLARGKVINTKPYKGQPVLAPDGVTAASVYPKEKDIRLWSFAAQKQVGTLTGHGGGVTSVAFSADGKTLYSASEDKTIRSWDLATRKSQMVATTRQVPFVAVSPDGKWLLWSDGAMVKVQGL